MTTSGWARARANANIAFIKYWGNTDDGLRLPANSSLSMNLDGLYTETRVEWDSSLMADQLILNGEVAQGKTLQRVSSHLDVMRERMGFSGYAAVESRNNFPMGAGIASSAASFAALTVAAADAAHFDLSER
jgi:diphosphomevalonate decarboxylase